MYLGYVRFAVLNKSFLRLKRVVEIGLLRLPNSTRGNQNQFQNIVKCLKVGDFYLFDLSN